ncbi:precorrin-6y C5,15-methyltransferase (decarboxylating) subunit CbiE [Chloroflexota bacterium]
MKKVYIVGTGPGSPRYLTTEAQRVIREADILVGWDQNFDPVRSLIVDKKVYLQDVSNYIQVARQVADEARKNGKTVAVVRIGDPCISSGLIELLEIFHDFEIKIIPGISSVQMAAAASRINLDESVIISFHEGREELSEKQRFMLDAFRRNRHLIVLTGQVQKPDETASFLINNGISEKTPTIVCENLTLEDEKIFQGTLRDVTTRQFTWLSVMVIKQGDIS